MPDRIAKRLLIIGWDAADWKLADPLLARGEMPNLARLVAGGVRADLASLDPKLSPLLWTSVATGKTADKHGILNFIEPDPAGPGVRIVSSTTRKTKALWNILTQSGLRTHVVNWYATHPAEPIRGVCVSNLFQEGCPEFPEVPWPVPPGAVHPRQAAEWLAPLRMHPGLVQPAALLPLVPRLSEAGPRDHRLPLLARLLAQCVSVHNVVTALLDEDRAWDCAMVFYDAIDTVGHHFMQYYPPRMPHVSERDAALYQDVMPALYKFHDLMLGTLLDLAGPDTTVILLSDHGFHSDHLRPRVQASPDDPHAAMDASWHRPLGVLAMGGPGISPGRAVYGATLLDIAPTALALLGVPVGGDMDGRVLVEAIDRPVQIERVFGWDALEGDAGLHPPDLRLDPFEARGALTQLADLGYIEASGADSAGALAALDRETRFNLGVVYLTTRRTGEALGLFEALAREYPDEPRFVLNYAHGCYAAGRAAEAGAVLDRFVEAHPDLADAQLLRGAAHFAQGRLAEAGAALEAAERRTPDRPDLLCSVGEAYVHLRRFDDAQRTLGRALALDPHDPRAHHALALLALARERFEEAVDHSLRAVELRHFYPEAHYALGTALTWLKDYDRAIQSFRVALSMRPGMVDAHRYIASIYRHLNDRRSARPHRDAAEQLIRAAAVGQGPAFAAVREPPLGPREWARRLGVGEDDAGTG